MKLLPLLTLLSTATFAHAQSYYTQHFLGGAWSTTGPGYSGYGQRIGNQYFYHDNYGNGFGQRIGKFDFYNFTPNRNPFLDDDDQ